MTFINDEDKKEIRRVRDKVDKIRGGPGVRVHHDRDGIVVSLLPKRERGATQSRPWFWAKITSSASLATNRYKYAWTEQERTASGWQNKTGGRSGTTTTGYALNSIEANNDGTGAQGNSIDIDGTDFPAGFTLQAVRGDPVVRMWQESATDGTAAYSFEYVNAVDGTCS